jgi:hypothetical protein
LYENDFCKGIINLKSISMASTPPVPVKSDHINNPYVTHQKWVENFQGVAEESGQTVMHHLQAAKFHIEAANHHIESAKRLDANAPENPDGYSIMAQDSIRLVSNP